MPYIKKEAREELLTRSPATTGELNYAISKLLVAYTQGQGMSYGTFNDVLGAMEGAKLEFVRRMLEGYEDLKIAENGDIYDV